MPPSALVEDAAIAVGATNYGDSHRIVRLLTPTQGRISVMARYARGSRRRFQGSLDLGCRIDVVVRKGRGELWHLDQADLVDARLGVRQDYALMAHMAYACEVTSALANTEQPEPALFGLLDMACTVLSHIEAPPKSAFRVGLELKTLTFAGLAPSLAVCAVCGEAPTEALALRIDGSCVHEACEEAPHSVSDGFIRACEAARRTPLRDLIDTPLPPGPAWVFAHTIEGHIGRALKSRPFLASIDVARTETTS